MNAIMRQIRKNKTRLSKKLREGAFLKTASEDVVFDLYEEEEKEFPIRTKSFKFKPMSYDEAIMQMNLLEHDFYVFVNEESGEVNVVYKKKDGSYGCIIPE